MVVAIQVEILGVEVTSFADQFSAVAGWVAHFERHSAVLANFRGSINNATKSQRDVSYYLMPRYNRIRPQYFNQGLSPAVAEEQRREVSEMR